VRDRSAPTRISNYFQQFLGARRRFTPTQLTAKLADIAKKVARANEALLDPAVTRGLGQRVYDVIRGHPGFDPANREPFIAAVYGPLAEDSKVRADFDRELRRERIDGEAFDLDPGAVAPPARKRLITVEGIEVTWDRQFDDLVRRESLGGGRVRITIETGGVRAEGDYAEPRPH
jgi:hypothetical protein